MNSPRQNYNDHIPEDDLTMFALQSLPEDESARIVEHLQGCEICRLQLGQIQGDLALFALTSELQELPPQAREHFHARLQHEKQEQQEELAPEKLAPVKLEPEKAGRIASPVDVPPARAISIAEARSPQPRARGAVVLAWTGWALAAAASAFAYLQFQQRQSVAGALATQTASLSQATQQASEAQAQAAHAAEALQALTGAGAMQVSLQLPATKAPQPEAHAAYMARTGALVLVASHLTPLAAGKTYELWLLPAQAKGAPIPAGTFKPDGHGYANVVLPPLPKGVEAKGFGVTVEPDGGSAAPTPPIVLAGF